MALKTEDCRKWLAANPQIRQLVKDRYGWESDHAAMLEMCDGNADEVSHICKMIGRSLEPKSWKRTNKYKLGSKTDKEWFDYHSALPDGTEGIVRHFQLLEEEINLVILECGGQLSFLDDLSD